MPTDTTQPIDRGHGVLDELLDQLLAQEPGGAALAAQQLRGYGIDTDALVEFLVSALRRRGHRGGLDPVGFLGSDLWAHTAEQRMFTRTYSADVLVRIEPVSTIGGGWLVFIGGNLLRRADGSVAVFDTSEAAMRSAERVMTEMKTTVAIPAAL